MTSTHRLIAIIFIWIVSGWSLFFAMGQSLFMPESAVLMLVALVIVATLAATFMVSRATERKTHPQS